MLLRRRFDVDHGTREHIAQSNTFSFRLRSGTWEGLRIRLPQADPHVRYDVHHCVDRMLTLVILLMHNLPASHKMFSQFRASQQQENDYSPIRDLKIHNSMYLFNTNKVPKCRS